MPCKRRFFRCECYGEGLAVEYDSGPHDFDGEVLLSFWQMGRGHKPTLGMRIRHLLRIVFTGTPYGDMVILTEARARELGRYLLDVAADRTSATGKGGE